jgi:hypothetical protein
VKGILFSFCNGELFRMVVNYDRCKTEGLTDADMIEAISANYGTATRPAAEIIFPSVYNESVKVIARWEDPQYSFNLVRSSSQPSFGMLRIRNGWMPWPERLSPRRSGWTSKRFPKEKSNLTASKRRRFAPSKRRPG